MTYIVTNYQTLRRPNFVTLILVLDSIFDSLSVKVEIKTDSASTAREVTQDVAKRAGQDMTLMIQNELHRISNTSYPLGEKIYPRGRKLRRLR